MMNTDKKLTLIESYKDIVKKIESGEYELLYSHYICNYIAMGLRDGIYPIKILHHFKNELLNMEKKFWKKTYAYKSSNYYDIELLISTNRPFWTGEDTENRIEFLNYIINKLEENEQNN